MTRYVAIVGTDTGVGKTFVTASLARVLAARGHRVVAIKPIESGCDEQARDREDGALLARATGQSTPREALIRLRAPLAPALAAEREGVVVEVGRLIEAVRDLASGVDVALVEGAGGVLSPLSWTHDVTDLARGLAAQVLLVGSDHLGVLHQVRAAMRVLIAASLAPSGLVLSAPSAPDPSTSTNAAALRRLSELGELSDRIAVVPRTADIDVAARALRPVVERLV